MSDKLVKARWVASYPAEMADKTQLVPGETVVEIPKVEAEASDNWEIVGGSKAKAKDGDS